MPNTKRDKYDEVADSIPLISTADWDNAWFGSEKRKRDTKAWRTIIASILRSAFPPPAEDAQRLREKIMELYRTPFIALDWEKMADAEIESFAQSRVEPWREALRALDAWWRLPNSERTIDNIEPAMRLCAALLSGSPAKEDAK